MAYNQIVNERARKLIRTLEKLEHAYETAWSKSDWLDVDRLQEMISNVEVELQELEEK